jgi:hypothetical protein
LDLIKQAREKAVAATNKKDNEQIKQILKQKTYDKPTHSAS